MVGKYQEREPDARIRYGAPETKSIPGWTAGTMLRALIECRLGRYDQAQAIVRRLLDPTRDEPLATGLFWVIGAELEDHGPTRELAVTAYEASLNRGSDDDPYNRLQYDNGPAKRLVTIYARDNRLEDARRVLVDFARVNDLASSNNYPTGYIEQMKMSALGSAAAKLHELGFAADAVALYNQSLALSREIPPNGPMYYGNTEGMIRQYQDGLSRAYPLSGTFEFSVEGYIGRFAESGLSHNGLVIEPFALNFGSFVFPVGQSETLNRPWRLTRWNAYNRMTVQATPGKVRYLVNGHLCFEDDDPSPTSPWLGLFTRTVSHTAWRLVSLSGRPAIPRELH